MTSGNCGSAKYDVSLGRLGAKLEVAADETESGVALVRHTLPPGTLGAPLHRHAREDELSYVLDGEMTVRQAGELSTHGAGDAVVKARGVWHTFWNESDRPLRFLEVIAPGGFASFFEEAARALAEEPPGDRMDRLVTVARRYDMEIDPESVPTLIDRHDLNT